MLRLSLLLSLLCASLGAVAQTAFIRGQVRDEAGGSLDFITVGIPGTTASTQTERDGSYFLQVPANQKLIIVFQSGDFDDARRSLTVAEGDTATLDISLKSRYRSIGEVERRIERGRGEAGTIYIDPARSQEMPSTIGGIEGILKTFVGTNNELTSQYSVRGGNYDENLVYVNDFEINRPYLTRSGQQEGLSFVNADLASGVQFSLGGFAARYGDKMSSVLDVTYRRPKKFGGSASASLLGLSAHLEGIARNGRITSTLR